MVERFSSPPIFRRIYMLEFLFKRLGLALITLTLITFVVFFIIQLPPGDFVDYLVTNMVAEGEQVTAQEVENMREMYGLNRPFIIQYGDWLIGVLKGDWGTSLEYQVGVLSKIQETLGTTLMLSFTTLIFTWVVSIPIAIYSSRRQYSLPDYIVSIVGFLGMAIPNFMFAIILMYFSFKWTGKAIMGFPEGGVTGFASFFEYLKHMIIPVIVIGTGGTCGMIRSTRAMLLDEQDKPHVLALRAKGASENRIVYKYDMKTVMLPTVAGLGYMIAAIFNGSTLTAIVLMLPTLGPDLLKALQTQDVFLSGGILLITSSLVVFGTLLSDILLTFMDPRIKINKEAN